MASFAFGLLLCSISVLIAWFDFQELRIPDSLNILLAIGGIGFKWLHDGAFPFLGIAAAAGLGSIIYMIRQVSVFRHGKPAIGLGDVKMAGAGAVWISPWNFPFLVLVASSAALSFASVRGNPTKLSGRQVVPFGPFLGIGILSVWIAENYL